jgi:Amt family ammonium transporter
VPGIDTGHTAWLLVSSALVLLMTPGLALFYGGMSRSKSVLNMLMMCFATIGLVSLLWVLYGYSLSFTGDSFNGLIGTFDAVGLRGLIHNQPDGGVPELAFVAFQLMFAVITPALIAGAIADRARFGSWLIFVGLWVTLVYVPVAHWVFYFGDLADPGDGGWIADGIKAFDFAGGTAVHVNAGAAALALAIVLGRRAGWPREKFKPHNLPMVLLGAGLLWFGWFGFNAGSALAANATAALAFVNTQVATACGLLGWIAVEWVRDKKPTTLGAASGAVAGLVAITPACATITPMGSIVLGLIAGAVCAVAVGLKYRLRYDDSLDVVGVHLVGGALGALLIGLLANAFTGNTAGILDEPMDGLLYGGGFIQLRQQAVAVLAVGAYSFVMALLLGLAIEKTIGFRVSAEAEMEGLDTAEHAESAYELSAAGTGGGTGAFALAGIAGSGGSPDGGPPGTGVQGTGVQGTGVQSTGVPGRGAGRTAVAAEKGAGEKDAGDKSAAEKSTVAG